MALTYIYAAQGVDYARALSGKIYTPVAGMITGVTPTDAGTLTPNRGTLRQIAATGATTDRPLTIPATALTGAINSGHPAPQIGDVFIDTTLSKPVIHVGTGISSTGWVDQTGASA